MNIYEYYPWHFCVCIAYIQLKSIYNLMCCYHFQQSYQKRKIKFIFYCFFFSSLMFFLFMWIQVSDLYDFLPLQKTVCISRKIVSGNKMYKFCLPSIYFFFTLERQVAGYQISVGQFFLSMLKIVFSTQFFLVWFLRRSQTCLLPHGLFILHKLHSGLVYGILLYIMRINKPLEKLFLFLFF